MSAVRKDLFDRWSNVIVVVVVIDDDAAATLRLAERRGLLKSLLSFLAGDPARRFGEEAGLRPEEFEFEESEPSLLGLRELRGLWLSHDDDDGDGEVGRVSDSLKILSGIGLGGIGEGSCQRCIKKKKKLRGECKVQFYKGEGGRSLTLNSKLAALGVMTVIS